MQPNPQTSLSPYTRIGGDAAIRKLVERFYELMDELPEAYATRKIHPADLTESANKLFDFLSGWMGGPQRYIEKHGHPMLRRRHFPYAIGPEERDQWLLCMKLALEETVADEPLRADLFEQFSQLGEHMRNRGGDTHSCNHLDAMAQR
ncbi:MAG: group II truncated hemoglobin [Anderseniella sp.]|nr:group II truncated hemoglobin [Anderseniella sp.]